MFIKGKKHYLKNIILRVRNKTLGLNHYTFDSLLDFFRVYSFESIFEET